MTDSRCPLCSPQLKKTKPSQRLDFSAHVPGYNHSMSGRHTTVWQEMQKLEYLDFIANPGCRMDPLITKSECCLQNVHQDNVLGEIPLVLTSLPSLGAFGFCKSSCARGDKRLSPVLHARKLSRRNGGPHSPFPAAFSLRAFNWAASSFFFFKNSLSSSSSSFSTFGFFKGLAYETTHSFRL
jgi:hypothetical protein